MGNLKHRLDAHRYETITTGYGTQGITPTGLYPVLFQETLRIPAQGEGRIAAAGHRHCL